MTPENERPGGLNASEEAVARVDQAIRRASGVDPARRDDLIRTLEELKEELRTLAAADSERARSIAQFAEAATHEAARKERSQNLQRISNEGLKESVIEFEATHPNLTAVVHRLASLLAAMGI